MYRRRHSPYSRIDEIERSRTELVLLVLVSVLAGVLLNMLANGAYAWLVESVQSTLGQLILFLLGVLAIAVLVAFIAYWFFGRQKSRAVQIDIVIPYHFPGGQYLTIIPQHKFRPHYEVAWLARTIFTRCFPEKGGEAQGLATEWQQAKAIGTPVQRTLAPIHGDLVDALLVYALHRYGEDALGPEAPFGWWQAPLQAQVHALDDLPDSLKGNAFLRASLGQDASWKLLLPQGVRWDMIQNKSGQTIRLVKPGWGQVTITRAPQIWVSPRSQQPGRVLTEGLRVGDRSEVYVLGSRLEIRADFEWSFLPNRDAFHLWAVGLLAQLEEALDWGFFMQSRADRIIWDMPWKLGDFPGPGTSLWSKLCQLEEKLQELAGPALEDQTTEAEVTPSSGDET